MTKSNAPAIVEETSAPEKLNPAQVAIRDMVSMNLVVNIVDDEVRAQRLAKTEETLAVAAFLGVKQEVARIAFFNALTSARLMFPATEAVRTLLGEDAPDLAGQTPEYKAFIEEVYSGARQKLTSRLRRDGYLGDDAINIAKSRVESVRKTVSLDYRKHMETVALEQSGGDKTAAAKFLLAHGFEYNTAVGTKKSPQAIPAKTSIVLRDEDGKLHLATEGQSLKKVEGQWVPVTPTPKAGEGAQAPSSDEATPSETADAVTAAETPEGTSPLNPFDLGNRAVGMLTQAASLLEGAPGTLEQRGALLKSLIAATQAVADAIKAEDAKVSKAPAAK